VFALLVAPIAGLANEPRFRPGSQCLGLHKSARFVLTDADGKYLYAYDFGDERTEPAAIGLSSWHSLSKSMAANDQDGLAELRTKKKILDLPNGTCVQIIKDFGGGSLFPVLGYEVRIKDGSFAKEVVYVPEAALIGIPDGMKLPDDLTKRRDAIDQHARKIDDLRQDNDRQMANEAAKVLQLMPRIVANRLIELHAEAMEIKITRRNPRAAVLRARRKLMLEGVVKLRDEVEDQYKFTSQEFANLLSSNQSNKWKCITKEDTRKSVMELFQSSEGQDMDAEQANQFLENLKREIERRKSPPGN
jgi:hypothetical protein